MKEEITLINGSELQRQLEPLYELKSDIVNLKTEISKKTSAKFYTIPQVCEILHVSRSTVYRMICNGNLKAHKAYRRVLVSEVSINNALIPINSGR
ncbi:MAG TPA: helix-turn-helix domain-containing protein [Bacteroides reticulotermitis]|nr:helix-turn-helix domain-containing protein [Bacteroides reticulotermitis]